MMLVLNVLLCLLCHQALSGSVAQPASYTDVNLETVSLGHGAIGAPDECLNDSLGTNCGNGSGNEVYSYETNPTLPLNSKSIESKRRPIYSFDHVSERDYANFLENSSKWQAEGRTTTLRQVLIIHRHGDRTPINFPPKDKLASEPFWTFHGLGQLTNRGKARVDMLGKIIRKRYNEFMGGSVNKNLRKSRSSSSLRCIESAEVFLSSFLALDQPNASDAQALIWEKNNQKLGHIWQPASVSSFTAKYDGLLNEGAECKALNDEYIHVFDPSEISKRVNKEYSHERDVLYRVMGFETEHFYKWFWAASLLEVERSYFEHKMNPDLLKIYDRVQEAGLLTLGLYQSTLKSKRLRAGLLINDMIKNMKTYRDQYNMAFDADVNPSFAKKFVHYSAHDLNLVVLLGMFNATERFPSRPDYASNILIELHQDTHATKDWFVRLFYMQKVPSEPQELYLDACKSETKHHRHCTLDQFDDLMQQYKIDNWQNWMQECGNDFSQFDPYLQNT